MNRIFHFFKHMNKRALALLLSSVLLTCAAVGTTVAWIMQQTEPQGNTFTPPDARIALDTHDEILNKGNIPVYVRAMAVVNWYSTAEEHTILSEKPVENVDFEIDTVAGGWFLASDGFYYRTEPLAPGESVTLFTNAYQIKEKTGYELRLLILSESIQTYPIDAIHAAWPAVTVNDGKLEARNPEQGGLE